MSRYHYPYEYSSFTSASRAPPYNHNSRNTYYDFPTPVSPLPPSERHLRPPAANSHQGHGYHNAYDVSSPVSPIMSRSPSVAGSDRFSTISAVTGTWLQNPNDVHPAAAYVAQEGAAQIVTEHRSARRRGDTSDDEESEANKDDIQFSSEALRLTNFFIDQILYSILSAARSTSLYALKPAVTEVLKARLAREAIASADEELQDLLAGGEEEEEKNTARNTSDASRKWDLELVWKRTRLRVMVYMQSGDMDQEDEERYVKEQELFSGRESDSRRFSANSGLVSWPAAIFLTSVLEHVAEQTLQVAGSAAYARTRRQSRAGQRAPALNSSESPDRRVLVDEYDVERVALDSRLGRLWRTWRKTLRNAARPPTPTHRGMASRQSFSRDGIAAALVNRRESVDTMAGSAYGGEAGRPGLDRRISQSDVPEMQYPEHVMASNIPLPMQDARRDVDEIEVPGLARDPEEEDDGSKTPTAQKSARRNSFTHGFPFQTPGGLSTPAGSNSPSPAKPPLKPLLTRMRSTSVPTPMRTPMLEIPGAFPTFQDEQKTEPVAVDVPTEQKTRAAEVDTHGHNTDDVKVLLDRVSNHTAPDTESAEQKSKSEHHGLLGAAAAGATAVAGAAAAAVYSGHRDRSADKSLASDAALTPERTMSPPRSRTPQAIEELDRRKSLMEIKAVMAGQNGLPLREASQSRVVESPQTELARPDVARTESSATNKSFTLGNHDSGREIVPQFAEPQHMNVRASSKEVVPVQATEQFPLSKESNGPVGGGPISVSTAIQPAGIAEIDGTPIEPKAQNGPAFSPSTPQARETRNRKASGGVVPLPISVSKDSPVANQNESPRVAPKSPRDFLESRNLSYNSQAQAQAEKIPAMQSSNESTRATPPRQRQSSNGVPVVAKGVAQSPTAGQPYNTRQSAMERDGDAPPKPAPLSIPSKQGPLNSAVQEHPAIQQMSSPKKTRQSYGEPGSSTPSVVTSASIRGPEDFDMFIQGEDTIKYTLTPGTVRGEPARGAQAPPAEVRPVENGRGSVGPGAIRSSGSVVDSAPSPIARQAPPPVLKQVLPPAAAAVRSSQSPLDTRDSRTGRSQASKHVTAAQVQDESRSDTPDKEKERQRRRSISRPTARNTSAHRRSGLMAREPQVLTESTRDFADWIRSTGPDKEPDMYRLNTNRSTASLHSVRSVNGSLRSQSIGAASSGGGGGGGGRERTKSLTKSDMVRGDIPPVPPVPMGRPSSSKGKASLQARSATGAASGNSDLINFIRDGPEDRDQHRISRSVAPFRNTMDSDQFNDMGGGDFGNAVVPPPLRVKTSVDSGPSTKNVNSTAKSPSTRTSSLPQRSALVNGSASGRNTPTSVHPAHSGQPQRLAVNNNYASAQQQQPNGDISKKRYRNKDPYAIDLDSDEENLDSLTALPRGARRQEESLADFLRNSDPPANNAPKPIADGGAAQAKDFMNRQRTSSVNSIKSAQQQQAESNRRGGSRTSSFQSQVGPQQAYASSTYSNSSTPMPANLRRPSAGQTKLEARGAGSNPQGGSRLGAFHTSDTGDLAEFLRSSGPPATSPAAAAARTAAAAPAPIVGRGGGGQVKEKEKEKKKRRGLFGFVGRRREERGERKTWGDMP